MSGSARGARLFGRLAPLSLCGALFIALVGCSSDDDGIADDEVYALAQMTERAGAAHSLLASVLLPAYTPDADEPSSDSLSRVAASFTDLACANVERTSAGDTHTVMVELVDPCVFDGRTWSGALQYDASVDEVGFSVFGTLEVGGRDVSIDATSAAVAPAGGDGSASSVGVASLTVSDVSVERLFESYSAEYTVHGLSHTVEPVEDESFEQRGLSISGASRWVDGSATSWALTLSDGFAIPGRSTPQAGVFDLTNDLEGAYLGEFEALSSTSTSFIMTTDDATWSLTLNASE